MMLHYPNESLFVFLIAFKVRLTLVFCMPFLPVEMWAVQAAVVGHPVLVEIL